MKRVAFGGMGFRLSFPFGLNWLLGLGAWVCSRVECLPCSTQNETHWLSRLRSKSYLSILLVEFITI